MPDLVFCTRCEKGYSQLLEHCPNCGPNKYELAAMERPHPCGAGTCYVPMDTKLTQKLGKTKIEFYEHPELVKLNREIEKMLKERGWKKSSDGVWTKPQDA